MITPRPARYTDVAAVADDIRPADRNEIWAAGGVSPLEALHEGFWGSLAPVVGSTEDGTPVCMGGVCATAEPEIGCIWMLATNEIAKHPISFLRRSRELVDQWNREFPILTNVVDERNALHIKWLRWLGFTFIRRHPAFGHERRPFLEFVRIPPCATQQ